jgi:hypothetical protein
MVVRRRRCWPAEPPPNHRGPEACQNAKASVGQITKAQLWLSQIALSAEMGSNGA